MFDKLKVSNICVCFKPEQLYNFKITPTRNIKGTLLS